MEKLGVGFVSAGRIVNTHHVGAWRVRNARSTVVVKLMMAYYTAEKGKKPGFPLKVWKVLCPKWQREMESARSSKVQFGIM